MIAAALVPSPRPHWRRTVIYGLLWGIATTAVEAALPLGHVRGAEVTGFLLRLLLLWCIGGVTLAIVLTLFGRRAGSTAITLAFAAIAPLLASTLTNNTAGGITAHPLHVLWGGLVYGGLFVLTYRLHERSESIRGVLAHAEIARQRTETLLSAEQLKAMQGQVDPAFLLRVMTQVESRYGRDHAGVDRLLDSLVGFLRDAMPGVRSGASTLLAELRLARAYARVLAEFEPGGGRWRIDVPDLVPEVPFPPLLMLPVLDRLASGTTQGIVLELRNEDGRCMLTLHRPEPCDPTWLGSELDYRLRVGLRTTLGDAWSLRIGDGAATPAFVLNLAAPDAPPSTTNPLEDLHGQDAELLRSHP
jgi:hypothetical protein